MGPNLLVILPLILLTIPKLVGSQEDYNACSQALTLCPGEVVTVNNFGANVTFCPNCEDDFSNCFTPQNSIWFTFTTNSFGGDVDVSVSNLFFVNTAGAGTALQATLLQATIPCNSASYTFIGNCVTNGSSPFQLSGLSLLPNTQYYLVINGSAVDPGVTEPAQCSFDIVASGPGIDRSPPSVAITAGGTSFCANQIITITVAISDCPDNPDFRWYVNDIPTAVTTEPYFQSSSLVNGDIVRVDTDCYQSCPITVSDELGPLNIISIAVDAGSDMNIVQGDTVQLNGSTSATTFLWSPSFALSAEDALNPFVWPNITTTYTLTATDGSCSQSDQVTVHVEPELFFPNTFSPNDDGSNDTWQIKGVELYQNAFVRIYDRWGQEIFQSTGYSENKAWDGTVPSGKVTEGVYFYIVDLRDPEGRLFKGSITVIR